ncbi:GerAB/ArcD/ProY family transporter [Paenibacillus sp. strain BS8-2]
MDSPVISLRQTFWLYVNSRFIITLVFIPQFTEMVTSTDVIPAMLLNLPMDLLFAVVFVRLWLHYPNQTLVQYTKTIAGRYLGTWIGMCYLIYFLLHLSITLRIFETFMSTNFFPRTPPAIISFSMIAIAAYCIFMGLEVLGRCAEVLAPIIFLCILVFVGLAAHDGNWQQTIPIWDHGVGSILVTNIPASSRWNELAWMAMIMPFVSGNHKIIRVVVGGVLFLRIIWLALLGTMVAVFGPDSIQRLQFPTLELVEMTSIGDFLDRIEVFALGIWVCGAFLKLGILYYATVLATSQLTGLKRPRSIILPIGLLGGLASMWLADNAVELRSLGRSMTFVDILFCILLPLMLLVLHQWKQWRRQLKLNA